jgi:DNA repair protein SbcC/Rad50
VGDCYIKKGETKTPLSTTELKERVLDIIKFNEPPNPRAQSVIYRYAIFTPQEEMKEVLLREDDERLETLRKAFRLEEYSVATENCSLVVTGIGKQSSFFEGAASGLDDNEVELQKTREEVAEIQTRLEPLRADQVLANNNHESKKKELEDLKRKKIEMSKAEERVPLLRRQLNEKRAQSDRLSQQNQNLLNDLRDTYEPKIRELESVERTTDLTEIELKQQREQLSDAKSSLERMKARLDERLSNFDSLVENRSCPVCERPIEPNDFATKSGHVRKERDEKQAAITENQRKIGEIERLIDELGKFEKAQSTLEPLLNQRKSALGTIEENKIQIAKLSSEISGLQGELKTSEEEIKPLQEVSAQIQIVQNEVDGLQTQLINLLGEISGKEERARGLRENETKLLETIVNKKAQLRKKDSLNEHRSWLTEYFVPTVQLIEQQALVQINLRFNQQFQKWFQLLLDDPDLQARVDESFAPIIEREGYQQEFPTLSGGEKTSVALAYRLALNMLVQEISTGTNNLLILDEPTDGFSKEQLSKIREILNQLACPQVILVSHENELEAFADQVIKVSKKDGVSHVTVSRTQE